MKVYREQKDIITKDEDEEDIERKIRNKMAELQGLKRENSTKELRKSKEKEKNNDKGNKI